MNAPLYFDYAATSPLDPRVATAIHAAQLQGFANPASQHQAGRTARKALEQAREAILQLLGARTQGMQADRLLFTSGGTEANHLALLGLIGTTGGRVLLSAIEHPSLRGAGEALSKRGCAVEYVRVDRAGLLDLEHLDTLLATAPKPRLVSIMLANNETGVLQPIAEIAQCCSQQGVLFHTDAVQAIGKLPLSFAELGIDALTIAPHKFYGPIGIGGLLIRSALQLEPLLRGGFQQAGLRAGTESVVLAIGFAAALQFAQADLLANAEHLSQLQTSFEAQLRANLSHLHINSSETARAPHISNVAFLGVDRQQLFLALDLAGVHCSTGSACASGSSEPSPVLLAMGLAKEVIDSSLRFSFGSRTTLADTAQAVDRISKCVKKLRRE